MLCNHRQELNCYWPQPHSGVLNLNKEDIGVVSPKVARPACLINFLLELLHLEQVMFSYFLF